MLYFCSRGRENRGDMSRETFIIHEEGGSRFITIRDAKNNCENDTEQSQGGVMMESSNNPRCPVSSFFIFFLYASGQAPSRQQVPLATAQTTCKSEWAVILQRTGWQNRLGDKMKVKSLRGNRYPFLSFSL